MVTTHTIPVQETRSGEPTGGPAQQAVMDVHGDMLSIKLLMPERHELYCPNIWIERLDGFWRLSTSAEPVTDEVLSVSFYDSGDVIVEYPDWMQKKPCQ